MQGRLMGKRLHVGHDQQHRVDGAVRDLAA